MVVAPRRFCHLVVEVIRQSLVISRAIIRKLLMGTTSGYGMAEVVRMGAIVRLVAPFVKDVVSLCRHVSF